MGAFAIGASAVGAMAIGRSNSGRAVINHLKIENVEVWRLRVEELDAASSRSLLPGAPSASMTPPIGETRQSA